MNPLLERLKQRKIVQWALAYLAGAGVLYSTLEGPLSLWGITDGQLRIVQVLLAVGFFLAVTLAWYHGERGEQKVTGVELLILAGIMGLGAIGLRLISDPPIEAEPIPAELRGARIATSALSARQGTRKDFAMGPRDRGLVFFGLNEIWYKAWDDDGPGAVVPGTEGASSYWVSPNGRWLTYTKGQEVYLVELPHGVTQRVPAAYGTTSHLGVDDAGFVYFDDEGLSKASVGDSVATQLVERQSEDEEHWFPLVLPNGRLLLTVIDGSGARIATVDDDGRISDIAPGAKARYAPSGHLIYGADGRVLASRFDLSSMEVLGEPVEIVPAVDGTQEEPFFEYADGWLSYQEGRGSVHEFVWVDRSGRVEVIDPEWAVEIGSGNAGWSLSNDGSQLAWRQLSTGGLDIWTKRLPDGPALQLTFDPEEDRMPQWAPDDEWLTFLSRREGNLDVWRKRADGTGMAERLMDWSVSLVEAQWSPDGTWLVARTSGASGQTDILGLRPGVDADPISLIADQDFSERGPAISPDGRWIAYLSDESGIRVGMIRPFPNVNDGVWRVSEGGARRLVWSPNGDELFYYAPETGQMMSAQLDLRSGFGVRGYETLFTVPTGIETGPGRDFYDVAPDGSRFVMARTRDRSPRFVYVADFDADLQRLLPR